MQVNNLSAGQQLMQNRMDSRLVWVQRAHNLPGDDSQTRLSSIQFVDQLLRRFHLIGPNLMIGLHNQLHCQRR